MTPDWGGLADGELMALCCAGRQAAFAEVMRRHRDRVYRIALSALGDPDDALDVVQEAFLSAHRAACRYDPAQPLPPWLATITLNKCRDLARRRRVRRFLSFGLGATVPDVVDERPGADRLVDGHRRVARVRDAVARLPVALREPLVLHLMEGMSQAETALALGISGKAVETRVRRARVRLTELLGNGDSAPAL